MNYNLNFHQTFPPTLEYIGNILDLCDFKEPLTKFEISDITGIPTGKSSGKVEPHIKYAEYMGLVEDQKENGKHFLIATNLGREIKKEDPGFQENITKLVCHTRLTSKNSGAIIWSAILRDILPNYKNGIEDIVLQDELKKLVFKEVNLSPFYSTYSKTFQDLNLIKRNKTMTYINKLNYDKEFLYAYAYSFLYEYEKIYPHSSEITANDLQTLKFNCAFGWGEKEQYQALEYFAEAGIIKLNRQLTPFTIIKVKNSVEMIGLIYSLLC